MASLLPSPFAFETGVNCLLSRPEELADDDFFATIAEKADSRSSWHLHNVWANEWNGRLTVAGSHRNPSAQTKFIRAHTILQPSRIAGKFPATSSNGSCVWTGNVCNRFSHMLSKQEPSPTSRHYSDDYSLTRENVRCRARPDLRQEPQIDLEISCSFIFSLEVSPRISLVRVRGQIKPLKTIDMLGRWPNKIRRKAHTRRRRSS